MRGAVLFGPRDIRFVERDDPQILEPTDAIIGMSATCVCGSDLWPYRGFDAPAESTPMRHEYCGIVEEVGRAVRHHLPELIDVICERAIDPGKAFDLTLPLEQVAEGYRAMDERRAIKTLLMPRADSSERTRATA